MNKAYFILIPILFVVGFFAYSNRTALINTVKPVTNVLGSTFIKAQDVWNSIPNTAKDIIKIGIPSAFAVFFAWAKLRTTDKLIETQTLASQTTNQLQGELKEAQTVNTNLQGTIQTLSSQPTGADALKLREALLTNEEKDIRIRNLEKQIHDLQALVYELKLKVKALEIRNTELSRTA